MNNSFETGIIFGFVACALFFGFLLLAVHPARLAEFSKQHVAALAHQAYPENTAISDIYGRIAENSMKNRDFDTILEELDNIMLTKTLNDTLQENR